MPRSSARHAMCKGSCMSSTSGACMPKRHRSGQGQPNELACGSGRVCPNPLSKLPPWPHTQGQGQHRRSSLLATHACTPSAHGPNPHPIAANAVIERTSEYARQHCSSRGRQAAGGPPCCCCCRAEDVRASRGSESAHNICGPNVLSVSRMAEVYLRCAAVHGQ